MLPYHSFPRSFYLMPRLYSGCGYEGLGYQGLDGYGVARNWVGGYSWTSPQVYLHEARDWLMLLSCWLQRAEPAMHADCRCRCHCGRTAAAAPAAARISLPAQWRRSLDSTAHPPPCTLFARCRSWATICWWATPAGPQQ